MSTRTRARIEAAEAAVRDAGGPACRPDRMTRDLWAEVDHLASHAAMTCPRWEAALAAMTTADRAELREAVRDELDRRGLHHGD